MYDEKSRLTREGMEHAINAGGSVAYKQRIISRVEDLPSAEDLAETVEEKEVAKQGLEAQIAALNARLDKLVVKKTDPAHPPKK